MIQIPHFEDNKSKVDWLIANKGALIAQKKSAMKYADAVVFSAPVMDDKGEANKAEITPETNQIKVRSVINTTKLLDSHQDVHLDGIWNKSVKENKNNYLVQEHDFSFKGIITENVKVSVQDMAWKDLGYDTKGTTQALVYDSVIDKNESPVMFERYKSGRVKNHSVGMQYVKIDIAVNDKDYPEAKALWDKHIDTIANKEDAESLGYFFAVSEAKAIEGSAVVRGSNPITPTISTEAAKGTSTEHTEPEQSTQKAVTILINPNLF